MIYLSTLKGNKERFNTLDEHIRQMFFMLIHETGIPGQYNDERQKFGLWSQVEDFYSLSCRYLNHGSYRINHPWVLIQVIALKIVIILYVHPLQRKYLQCQKRRDIIQIKKDTLSF